MLIDCHTHAIKPGADISVLSVVADRPLPKLAEPNLLSCGIHPWHIDPSTVAIGLQGIEELCLKQKIAAIGECGLDKNTNDILLQKSVFEQQISLSEKYGLPLIIHSVKTHHLILELKKQLKTKQTWIIHGYNGSLQMAEQFIDKEIFISFGGNLMTKPEKLKKVLKQIDLSFVLLETDDSDIRIGDVYGQAAKLLGMELNVLIKKIEENFKQVFR